VFRQDRPGSNADDLLLELYTIGQRPASRTVHFSAKQALRQVLVLDHGLHRKRVGTAKVAAAE